MSQTISRKSSKSNTRQHAVELLDWLVSFLPTAIPTSAEEAILDTSGDVNALLWHRSELEAILQKQPSALSVNQRLCLADLDRKMRESALSIVGAEKGYLRHFREGYYDRSHWWWYLDEILREEVISKQRSKPDIVYPSLADSKTGLSKVADRPTTRRRKNKLKRK